MGVGLIAVGVLWILSLAGVDLRRELTLPGALIAIGLLVTLGVRWSAGLVEPGIIVTVIALDTSALATPAPVSAGDPSVAVSSVAELESSYWLGAGTLTLDLRELDLLQGTTSREGPRNPLPNRDLERST